MYDNPTGVTTNAPPFDWHLAHLGMYRNLWVTEPKPLRLGTPTLQPPSSGVGSVGLPGDMTSRLRFLRAFLFSYSAPKEPTSSAAVRHASHILNNLTSTLRHCPTNRLYFGEHSRGRRCQRN